MSKKKHILKLDSSDEDIALGLASSESEFYLSFLLNSFLSIKLSIVEPISKDFKTNKTSVSFPCFKFDNEDDLQVILIKNKQKGFLLFQNQPSFDYILLLLGSAASKNVNSIQKEFKSQSNISLISVIDTNKLANYRQIST